MLYFIWTASPRDKGTKIHKNVRVSNILRVFKAYFSRILGSLVAWL